MAFNRYRADFYLFRHFLLGLGCFQDTKVSTTQTLKLIFGINDTFRVRLDKRWFTARTVLIDSRVPHFVDGEGDWQLVLWIDPETSLGTVMRKRVLKRRGWSTHRTAPPLAVGEVVQTAGDTPNPEDALRLAEILIKVYSGARAVPATWDERVKNIVLSIDENPGVLSSDSLADSAQLSSIELDTDFRRVLGTGLDEYLHRRKMAQFIQLINQGMERNRALESSGLPGWEGLLDRFEDKYGLDLSVLVEEKPFVRVYNGPNDQASLYI